MPRGVLPMVVLGLAVSAVGELAGFALGLGAASDRLAYFEFHRLRHVKKAPRGGASRAATS